MRLTSIKSHGFKSFADKIEINIRDGITGIVGPNGSGKSNIVDAVRWVLGEQSIKNLRGNSNMTDVIFQGSSSRKPMSHAWVSLTFDNTDHYLNSDFKEIEIKRVVYSTGENEYFINNVKVRLKDITELFIDTGSSTNSFSIISQGKISEILSGKKEDRRAIIEEAAGVLKYKKHKEETLKKIDKANLNIEKIDLIIKELEDSLEPLKNQRDAALEYQTIKKEADDLDIILTTLNINECEFKTKELKRDLDEINKQILNIDSNNTKDNSILEKLKLNSINIDKEINILNENLINLNKKISELEAKKQVALERKKYEVTDSKLQENILNLKEKELIITNDLKLVNNKIDNLKQDIEELSKKLEEINQKYKESYLNKINLTNELNKKNLSKEKLKNKITILENNIMNDYSIPSSVKNILNNPRLNGVHNIIGKLIDINVLYKDALSIALGYNSNVIVVDNEISAKECIKYLNDNKLGRCTFFPLNIIKPKKIDDSTLNICKKTKGFINTLDKLVEYNEIYKNVVLNLLGNIIVVDNIDTMNTLGKKINYSYRIVTLNGEILHAGGSITGGTLKSNNSIILDKFELETLKKELESVKKDESIIEERLNSNDDELLKLDKEIKDLNNKLNNINNKLNINNKDKENLEEKLKTIKNEIKDNENIINDNIDSSIDLLLKEYYTLKSNREILNNDLSKKKIEKNDCLSEIEEIEINNRKTNSEYNKLINNQKNKEIDLNKLEIEMDNSLIKLNEEYSMTYDFAKNNYDLSIDIENSKFKLRELKKELSLLGTVNLGSIAEFDRINERFEYLTSQKLDLVNSINNLMKVITDLDETMKEKFLNTFNKVNIEFNKVFKKLFKGGFGELSLTDPDNILETGVDIVACPPGKMLKTINLLSGGEKTLTAIALLFAILNIRYVPFCILDEVEAALDEANVDMFGNYINEYKEKTKFIIITHKKRTMEYVNTLYGITMQESGVSKLVSVKLDD